MAPEGIPGLALKAVLWPSPGVLHVVGIDGPVPQFFHQREIVEILVSASPGSPAFVASLN